MIQEQLRDAILLTQPGAQLANGGKHVVFRCCFCGDSKKHSDSKHFYLSLGYNDEPPLGYCHICHASILVSQDFLMNMLGIYDVQLSIGITKYNRDIIKLSKNNKYNDKSIYTLNNSYIEDSDLSRAKLKYINNRLGIDLSYRDLLDNKIVLNLYDTFKTNQIKELTRAKSIVDELDRSFIGFISKDNAFMTLRNLKGKGKVYEKIDKRYIVYSIYGKFNNKERFYILPTNINLNDYNRVKINIAEGPFDILSIFYNLRGQQSYHNIYGAICGSGYYNMVRYFLLDLKLYNSEFHIYMDNDQDKNLIYNISDILQPYGIPLYLHINTFEGEKDFGVPSDRIKEYIEII